jgi:hypothetical protein
MNERARRTLILVGVLAVAGMLAFPLRDTIYRMVVIPAAFLAWNFNLLYRSYSQAIWWLVVALTVLFMLVFSLVPQTTSRRKAEEKAKPQLGQVEDLVHWLQKADRGTYFKWLVANRLGKLAHQMLLHRESGRLRSVFAPLVGPDWEPRSELQKYLETGLHGSFADYPYEKHSLGTPRRTPLDVDVAEAVEFLESKIENGHSSHRHGE